MVEIGVEIYQKPSREEKEKMRTQMDKTGWRAKHEVEQAKEKERIQREGLSASIFHKADAREPSRSRAGRDKVFYPKERHLQDLATRRDEDIQYRMYRQQVKELQERLARQEEASNRQKFVKNGTKSCQLPIRISPSELIEDLTTFCHLFAISTTNLLVVLP